MADVGRGENTSDCHRTGRLLVKLTLILLMWNIGRALNSVSKWQMEFNSAFKGLIFWSRGESKA